MTDRATGAGYVCLIWQHGPDSVFAFHTSWPFWDWEVSGCSCRCRYLRWDGRMAGLTSTLQAVWHQYREFTIELAPAHSGADQRSMDRFYLAGTLYTVVSYPYIYSPLFSGNSLLVHSPCLLVHTPYNGDDTKIKVITYTVNVLHRT